MVGRMSQGDARPRAEVLPIAERVMAALSPGCERIAIAGSLRREKPMVRDIEIVAVPRFGDEQTGDLWGGRQTVDLLEFTVSALMARSGLVARLVENHRADGTIDRQTKLGPSFKALLFEGTPVDLFVVRPPATWGVIFGLRTGPGDWNTRLVMDCKAIGRRVEGGQVLAWHSASASWKAVPTEDERSFFAALGQPWVEPRERHVDRVRIERTIAEAVPV
jgi:DNA polymerase/3'-5' exonuclease PolX